MTARKMASNLDANSRRIFNLPAPQAGSTDAARKIDIEGVQTYSISRANHTGTQLASTISDFVSYAQTNIPINTLAAATGPIGANAQRVTAVADPTAAQDAATKNYVDNLFNGVASGQIMKGAVRVVAKTNINIAAPGASVDSVALTAGDVIFLAGQTTASQGGPWVFNGSAAALTRPANFNSTTANVYVGSYWIVREGSSSDSFILLTNDTFTLGTTGVTTKIIDIAAASAVAFEAELGDGSATSFTVTHNLNTRAVSVTIYRNTSPYDEPDVYVTHATLNTVTVEPDETWSSGQFHVVVSKL